MASLPISMWRTMFSSMTMASSTTKPTDSVSAMSERLSRLYPSRYITANVPDDGQGRARLGMMVAERFRRNRKITRTTRAMASSSVNWTSWTESRIDCDRSYRMSRETAAGIWARNAGKRPLIASTTSTVFVPGWRWIASDDRSRVAEPAGDLVVLDAVDDAAELLEPDRGCRSGRRRSAGGRRRR